MIYNYIHSFYNNLLIKYIDIYLYSHIFKIRFKLNYIIRVKKNLKINALVKIYVNKENIKKKLIVNNIELDLKKKKIIYN